MKKIYAALILLMCGCKSAEKIAAERSAREDRARHERIQLLKETREKYPCDTVRMYSVDTVESLTPGDTVIIDSITYITLPSKNIVRTVTNTVIDRAAEKEKSDSIASLNYIISLRDAEIADLEQGNAILDADNKRLVKRSNTLSFSLLGAILMIGVGVFLKIKNIF